MQTLLINGVVSYLNTIAAITSIIGANRILPIPAPSNIDVHPAVTYQIASDVSAYSLTGSVGVTKSRIVFTCFSPSAGQAQEMAFQIKAALSGYQGTLPNGIEIFTCAISNMQSGYSETGTVSTMQVHAVFTYSDPI